MSGAQASAAIEIQQLLSKAKQALAVDRLTTPAHDNAVAYLNEVLVRVPDEPRAVALLDVVVDRYAVLVEKAVDRAAQASAENLERALTFRNRAARVIAEHRLDNDALEQIDRHIAALGGPEAETQPILQGLFAGHVTLAETFLGRNDRAEAAWHAGQADALAERYGLEDKRWPPMKRRLAEAQAREPREAVAREERPVTDPETRLKLTELAAFYVASGRAEQKQGNAASAQHDEQAARDLIVQYELSDDLVKRLSNQFLLRASARIEPPVFKVYGTF